MEYRSERASTDSPRACSGERYWAVPTTVWVWVTVEAESSMALAMPKSMTFTAPVEVSMMFPGLMSRWTIPTRWEYSKASSTPETISTASGIGTASP